MKEVRLYQTASGREPFADWLENLNDYKTVRRIQKRLLKLEEGHYGDAKTLGEGLYELRFFFGAGYRVYFGEDGDSIVLLLLGGDKDSQRRDIERARIYWREYLGNA